MYALLRSVRLIPPETTPDAAILVTARAVRAFGDGFVSVLLPVYLLELGLESFQVGAVATSTLIGSSALSVVVGLIAHRFRARPLLVSAAVLMAATGVAFSVAHGLWPLLIVAFIGTLNPSSGDVSVFLPLEQSVLPQTVSPKERTALFARYSLVGSLVAAAGALCAGVPDLVVSGTGMPRLQAIQGMFVVYAALGLVALALYRGLSTSLSEPRPSRAPLVESRRMVYTMAGLFALDSFGGGFFVQSLLALWLFERFELSVGTAGTIFFWTGVLSAGSHLVAVPLARRFGLINTMVFTHLPSNILVLLTPFAPTLPVAIVLLLARSALSQMDVPTRNSYVMAVVPPAERAAAASITTVPRSLATAASPLLAGYLLSLSAFGWPLLIGGALKGTYDILLLALFAKVRPPEES